MKVKSERYVTEGSFDAYVWQNLETKARFIQQVTTGHTAVRSAADLESGALTYAEIKAIASGNPAVMEKVRIDTEVRKLDQLRAVHLSQQHNIRWQLRHLPREIADAPAVPEHLQADIVTRDTHDGEEFVMAVGQEVSGKGAREEAAREPARAVFPRRDGYKLRKASFRGFEILSRDQPGASMPDLFIRGAGTYTRTSTPTTRSAPCRVSSTHCAPSIAPPRRNDSSCNGSKKISPTIRPRPSGPSSTRRGSRNCWRARTELERRPRSRQKRRRPRKRPNLTLRLRGCLAAPGQ